VRSLESARSICKQNDARWESVNKINNMEERTGRLEAGVTHCEAFREHMFVAGSECSGQL